METGSSNTKNLVIAGVILAVLIFAGYYYTTRDRSSNVDLLVNIPVEGNQVIDGDLLSTLGQLKRLRLDETIFSNQTFISLTDHSRPLSPQTSGRTNPFAPIDASSAFLPSNSTSISTR